MNVLTSDKKMSLVIMPTEKCNFKCKYCYETFRKGKMSPAVQDAIINYVKKNIRNHTELAVIWFGGEPLEALANQGQLQAYKHYGFWQCMDTMNDKNKLEKLLEKEEAPWKVWD